MEGALWGELRACLAEGEDVSACELVFRSRWSLEERAEVFGDILDQTTAGTESTEPGLTFVRDALLHNGRPLADVHVQRSESVTGTTHPTRELELYCVGDYGRLKYM